MNNLTKNQETFLMWTVISISLAAIFIHYGNMLHKNYPDTNEKNLKKLGWTITLVVLLCIYITEQTINSIEERRLINSMIIFAGTFSYLYYLRNQPL